VPNSRLVLFLAKGLQVRKNLNVVQHFILLQFHKFQVGRCFDVGLKVLEPFKTSLKLFKVNWDQRRRQKDRRVLHDHHLDEFFLLFKEQLDQTIQLDA